MTSSLIALIDSKIQMQWSPEQVSGWLREEHDIFISYETIYLHIGLIREAQASYFNTWVEKENPISLVAKLNKLAEVLSGIE